MNRHEMITNIARILNRMIEDRGEAPRDIRADTRILGGDLPIDSLDLAAVVMELEELVGSDPFRDGFIEFRTVEELAILYCPEPKA